MKKLVIIFFTFLIIFFLGKSGSRYIGVNYEIEEQKLSNFKKIVQFYARHKEYKKLVNEINGKSKNKEQNVLNLTYWIYKNIKKITKKDDIIDNHPWTIVKRGIGTDDQFSDLLTVLLVHNGIDAFFYNKIDSVWHPLTFFSINKKDWLIIDPYYGIYFHNSLNTFSSLDQMKKNEFILYHFDLGIVDNDNIDLIFFDKNFDNVDELETYFEELFTKLPSSQEINSTNIFKRGRGSRSYVQLPINRLIYEFYKFSL